MAKAARPEPVKMTVAELLSRDDGSDRRYELVDGVVRLMAAPSPAHSTIVGNVAVALGARLKSPCRARVEYGVHLDWSDYDHYQVDLTVVCCDVRRGEPLPDPVRVVEVLSRESLSHDRGRKALDYKRMPGCLRILIVESSVGGSSAGPATASAGSCRTLWRERTGADRRARHRARPRGDLRRRRALTGSGGGTSGRGRQDT